MARFIAALVFAGSLLSASGSFAKDHEPKARPTHSVPELSAAGAAAGLILLGGAAAIVLGRRRARKS